MAVDVLLPVLASRMPLIGLAFNGDLQVGIGEVEASDEAPVFLHDELGHRLWHATTDQNPSEPCLQRALRNATVGSLIEEPSKNACTAVARTTPFSQFSMQGRQRSLALPEG